MPPGTKHQNLQVAPVNIRAQVHATHNSSFPFASPNPDDHGSMKSVRTGNTALSHNPFESPNSSTTTLADHESGATSDHDAWHLERYSEISKADNRSTQTTIVPCPKPANRPGLQVITDFSKPSYHTSNLLVDHVKAKQAETRRNHARSIISQKAVQVVPKSKRVEKNRRGLSISTSLVKMKGSKRSSMIFTDPHVGDQALHVDRGQAQKWIFIGARVPQYEVNSLGHRNVAEITVGLATPITPTIILTTPEGIHRPGHIMEFETDSHRNSSRPASSVYTAITCSKDVLDEDQHAPPVPPVSIPKQLSTATSVPLPLRSTSLQNATETQVLTITKDKRTLLEPTPDTPSSQGWWNLLLSPLLSRAGSSASRQGRYPGYSPPPVPALPNGTPKEITFSPMTANISPETPRRLGLANIKGNHWSVSSDCESTKEGGSREISEHGILDQSAITNEERDSPGSVLQSPAVYGGLAAEYYHACAIEELTGVSYFECTNHSCSDRLPKLGAAIESPQVKEQQEDHVSGHSKPKAVAVLGSPFNEEKCTNTPATRNGLPVVRDENGSDTEFESDEEENNHLPVSRNHPHGRTRKAAVSIESPSEPDELSPNVRKADTAAFVKARALVSQDKAKGVRQNTVKHTEKELPNIAAVIPETQIYESVRAVHPEAARPAPEALVPQTVVPEKQMHEVPLFAAPDTFRSVPLTPPQRIGSPATWARSPAQPPSVEETRSMPAASLQKPFPSLPRNPSPSRSLQMEAPLSTNQWHDSQARSHTRPQYSSQQFFMGPSGGLTGLPASPAAKPAYIPKSRSLSTSASSTHSHFYAEKYENSPRKTSKTQGKRELPSWARCLKRKKSKSKRNDPDKAKKKKKRLMWCICLILLLMVVLCITLATTLTRKGDGTTVNSRWLNLTGYPPMPTGISTIAQPQLAHSQDQCVQPSTLWSCSLPKDDPETQALNNSGQPQFRFEIRYRNGTTPASMNIPLGKRANNPFTNDLYTPNPAPPNDADQLFLGNTTDNVTAPFNGEQTPFYITFMSTYPIVPSAFNTTTKSLSIRQTNVAGNIPAPLSLPDGTAALTQLLPTSPYAESQPIKLYNRGLVDEHYGFYIYYDKSVFLSGVQIENGTANPDSWVVQDADKNGGSTKSEAKVRCTWQQTRFLVRIYTSTKFDGTLLARTGNSTMTTVDVGNESQYSSATDFSQPGSFPYPATIAIDRHGGNINTKISYCYAMDKGVIIQDQKLPILENRSFGGNLINGAPTIIASGNSTHGSDDGGFDSSAGGIDGGTGGCGCAWQNWR